MNTAQKAILSLGGLVLLANLVFPPWESRKTLQGTVLNADRIGRFFVGDPPTGDRLTETSVDWSILGVTSLAVVIGTGLLFGSALAGLPRKARDTWRRLLIWVLRHKTLPIVVLSMFFLLLGLCLHLALTPPHARWQDAPLLTERPRTIEELLAEKAAKGKSPPRRTNTIDGLLEEAAREWQNKIDTTKLKLKCIEIAIEAYKVNVGHYPTDQEGNLKALRIKPSFNTAAMGQNWRGPYLKEEPLDSWGNKFNYQISPPGLPEGNLLPFKLWSNGPDGISGTADDIKNWFGGTTGK